MKNVNIASDKEDSTKPERSHVQWDQKQGLVTQRTAQPKHSNLVKRNRPKTPNGLIKAIERKLEEYQMVIRKIWRCNAGWGIVYTYGTGAKVPAAQRRFTDSIVFTYYNTIEICLKAEYDRIVLGINDGRGLMFPDDNSGYKEHLLGAPADVSVTAKVIDSSGVIRYRRMGKSLAEHWGLEILPADCNFVIFVVHPEKGKVYLESESMVGMNHIDGLDRARRFTRKSSEEICATLNKNRKDKLVYNFEPDFPNVDKILAHSKYGK